MERTAYVNGRFVIGAWILIVVGVLVTTKAEAQPLGERLALTLKANTVAVRADFSDGSTQSGFGMIVAEGDGQLWIATADHVVRNRTEEPTRITLRFYGRSLPQTAELITQRDAALDLAVLKTMADAITWYPRSAASNVERMRGAEAWFIGQSGQWYVPLQPGRINGIDPAFGIVLDGLPTQLGSSGAPLVTAQGISGLIASDSMSATSNAIPIDMIAQRFGAWSLPWSLGPLSLSRTRPVPIDGVDEAINAADRLRADGDLEAAAMRYAAALEIDPDDPLALRRAYENHREVALRNTRYPTQLFMDDETSAEALRLIYRLLEVDESIIDVELQLEISMLTRLAAGNWSIDYLISSLQPFLGDARIRAELGLLTCGYVSEDEGRDIAQTAAAELPDDPLAQRYLADCLALSDDLDGAAIAYAKTVGLTSRVSDLEVINRRVSLREFAEAWLALDEGERGDDLGNAPISLAEGARLLQMALDESPDSDSVHYLLARVLAELGQREAAALEAMKSISWPSSRPLGFYFEELEATPRFRARVPIVLELLRATEADPVLIYALERHVLDTRSEEPAAVGGHDGWLSPTLQVGHSGRVLAVAVSPDGSRIASAGDHSIRIWDAATGLVERVLGGPVGNACAVRFSLDGARVVAMDQGGGTLDGRVHIWDLETGRRLGSFGPVVNHPCTIEFDGGGAVLAVRGDTEELASWTLEAPPRNLALLADSAYGLDSSADGNVVAVIPCCDRSDVLELRATRSGALNDTFPLRQSSRGLAFAPAGDRIAVVGSDQVIEILDAETGERLQTLYTEITSLIESIAFSPDGTLLALGGRALDIWDVSGGRRRIQLGEGNVSGVSWMPEGHRLVAGYSSGTVEVWDVDSGQSTGRFESGHGDNAVAIGPGGDLLLIGTDGSGASERVWNASLWNLDARDLRCSIEHGSPFELARFSPDQRWFALGNDSNYDVEIWDTQCQTMLGEIEVDGDLAFAPNGQSVAYVAYDSSSSIVMRDLDTFGVIGVLDGREGDVSDIEFNPRDGRLASASSDGSIRIWEPSSGRNLRIEAHDSFAQWVTWSPDGKWLASIGNVSEVAIWNTDNGMLRVRFPAFFDNGPHALRFAPDGETLLAISLKAGTVTRWASADGRFLGALPLGESGVAFRSIMPAPDERTLALAIGRKEAGGPLLLVDLESGNARQIYLGLPDGGWVSATPDGGLNGPDTVIEQYVRPVR